MRFHPTSRFIGARHAVSILLALALLAACGDDDHGSFGSPTPRLDLSHATAARYTTRGSVEQIYVTDTAPGTALDLVAADGSIVASGSTDANGSFIFRDVAPAAGYRVASGTSGSMQASAAVTVTSMTEHPDAAFYAGQRIDPGYGYLETRDGIRLAINVILPGPIENGPYPAVIEYSGYSPADPDSPQPSMLVANALGYAVVGVNMRGTGCSGGTFRYFEPLQSTDGYDAVETIAAQPWVQDGRVGMVGISYPGISQLFVAQLRPPHLVAIAPLSVIADTHKSTLYPGGILNNGFAISWATDRARDAQPGGQGWSQKRLDAGDQVCLANQRLRGQTPDMFALISDNQYYRPEIADPIAPRTFVDRITVPVFLAGAWQDEQTGPHFATMLDRFTGTDKLHFTMTNGGHTDSLGPAILSRWVEFLSFYVARKVPRVTAQEQLLVQEFGKAIFGAERMRVERDRFTDAGSFEEALARFEAEPRVRILFENGAGGAPGAPVPTFEHAFARWPIPEVAPTAWYFAADGRLDPSPPTDSGADRFRYDTARSQTTTFNGSDDGVWKALPDWQWLPLDDGSALAYATDRLPDTVVMAGSGSVDLWLQSTARDVDVQATLSEIRPDGNEVYVQNGWLRASQRKLDAAASSELRPVQTHLEQDVAPLPAGKAVLLRVELFPFAHVFRAGSRIRLSIEAPGGTRARWKFDALAPDGDVTNTAMRSAAAPSRVVLPVIPGITAPAAAPPCPSLRAQPCRTYAEITNTPG